MDLRLFLLKLLSLLRVKLSFHFSCVQFVIFERVNDDDDFSPGFHLYRVRWRPSNHGLASL